MKAEHEAKLQSELAQEPDFVRRQQLLKALWHLSDQQDNSKAQPVKTAPVSHHGHGSARVAV